MSMSMKNELKNFAESELYLLNRNRCVTRLSTQIGKIDPILGKKVNSILETWQEIQDYIKSRLNENTGR